MNKRINLIKYAVIEKDNFKIERFFHINGKLFDDKKSANECLKYNENCIVVPVKVTYDFDMTIN